MSVIRKFRSLTTLACLLVAMAGWSLAVPRAANAAETADTKVIVAFDAANKLYEQGKFVEAARGYQQLLDAGHRSPALYFNLGNAWFKAGQTGYAIAAYRQIERLSPRDPNVQFNLNFARKQVASGDPKPGPVLERIVRALTLNEWTTLTAGAAWISFLLLAIGEWRESARANARRYALMVFLVALGLASGTAAAASRWFNPTDAVIVTSEAIARSGPLDEGKVLHQLRNGTEVTILDQKLLAAGSRTQTWYQVRNNAAQSGWIKEDQLQRIR